MEIKRIDSTILASNMYVISEGGHAIVIDPARDTAAGRNLDVDMLIVTHEHYDHISGVNAWKAAYHCPLLCSLKCSERVCDSKKNQARHFISFCELQSWMPLDVLPEIDPTYTCRADKTFEGEKRIEWQGHEFHLIEIPGHSPGSIGIYLDGTSFFSGDSLLEGREIELRFPGGSRKQWVETGKPRIEDIPRGTRIYPGHFESFLLPCT